MNTPEVPEKSDTPRDDYEAPAEAPISRPGVRRGVADICRELNSRLTTGTLSEGPQGPTAPIVESPYVSQPLGLRKFEDLPPRRRGKAEWAFQFLENLKPGMVNEVDHTQIMSVRNVASRSNIKIATRKASPTQFSVYRLA